VELLCDAPPPLLLAESLPAVARADWARVGGEHGSVGVGGEERKGEEYDAWVPDRGSWYGV
jgi:hypothetical protein